MRTFIVNYNWPLEYKGTYQVTVEDSLTANIDAADKVHKYLIEKFGEVKDSSSSAIIEVYDGTIHKIDDTKDEEWSEEDKNKFELLHTCICRCITDPYWDYSKRERASKELIPFIERLKSLHPQLSDEDIKKIRSEEYTKGFNDAAFGGKAWRPSKEQMVSLKRAAEHDFYNGNGATLRILYDDLKKL